MKIFLIIILCSALLSVRAQPKDNLDDRIHGMTTIVKASLLGHSSRATGFYFFVYDTFLQNHWNKINDIWLITNKHAVVFQDTHKRVHLANDLTFYLRYIRKDSLYWDPVIIPSETLKKNAKFSKDSSVDIVAISVSDLINKRLGKDTANMSRLFDGVSEEIFPGRDSTLTPQVSDDVIVVGYPSDFYDKKNLFPIVKTGIIASHWGVGFNGQPYFLIDSKLFPQSSGSLVLSKPSNFMVKDKRMYYSPNKNFVFLGIYSGDYERLTTDNTAAKINIEKYDLGVVWYYTQIFDIIKQGISWTEK